MKVEHVKRLESICFYNKVQQVSLIKTENMNLFEKWSVWNDQIKNNRFLLLKLSFFFPITLKWSV